MVYQLASFMCAILCSLLRGILFLHLMSEKAIGASVALLVAVVICCCCCCYCHLQSYDTLGSTETRTAGDRTNVHAFDHTCFANIHCPSLLRVRVNNCYFTCPGSATNVGVVSVIIWLWLRLLSIGYHYLVRINEVEHSCPLYVLTLFLWWWCWPYWSDETLLW